ncbi:unnamed protein product [Microthlaspi erraticum]|uniref:Probable small nuclear ribonucleoprotein G n=1 Tax=Microthlaspi erraticum TaxID=1685480 RepID=A0A6D2J789_9BRAS|nr:unnamed protein product [Microthlaspi erraticum]
MASMYNTGRLLRFSKLRLPSLTSSIFPKSSPVSASMDASNLNSSSSSKPSFSSFAQSSSGGRGRGYERDNDRRRPQGRGGGGGGGKDKIDALGRLLTRILRHMATELRLSMRGDGFVKVEDLLKLNLKTTANLQLKSHTIDEIREAVRRDNKQRFSLIEENGEFLIRANQGHSITTVESEKLLKPILSPEEAPVCVHGTYKKNLESILASGLKRMNRLHVHFSCGLPTDGQVISGMRRDVNVLIFLDIKKALQDGIAFYVSENKVILTEGVDGVVPVDYFQKIDAQFVLLLAENENRKLKSDSVTMSRSGQPPDLKKYMDKKLQIKLNANRMVEGTLRGFDQFMNLVVDNTVEVSGNDKTDIGMVVIRGNSIVTVEALEPVGRSS